MRAAGTDPPRLRAELARRVAGIYALTPDDDDTERLVAKVHAALAGGVRVVQYRHKRALPPLRRVQAQALAEVCRSHQALFIVNDDPSLAASVRADGVHIGGDDPPVEDARTIVGERACIGVSCYDSLERASAAVAAGADYVAFGSLFASAVKPGARRASLELFRHARSLGVPIVGIGGVDASNAGLTIASGANAVAIITALFGHDDLGDVRMAAMRLTRIVRDAAAERERS